jgi:hypothetical protein
MAFTYVLTTSIGQVRLLIPDRVSTDAFFEDAEITAFLALESSNVRRAAAMALETMASNEAYVQKAIRVLDLSTNGPAVAASLQARADKLRAQADAAEAAEDGGAFDIAEWVVDDFSLRQRIENEALRNL